VLEYSSRQRSVTVWVMLSESFGHDRTRALLPPEARISLK